ncbi:MAG TPA: hypothetical protein VHE12_03405 [bacterium]|nr:hypothetical protein [bacterium]
MKKSLHTYSAKYSDDLLLRGKKLFEEKANREMTMGEVLEWTESLVQYGEIIIEMYQKEMVKKKPIIERLVRILVLRLQSAHLANERNEEVHP